MRIFKFKYFPAAIVGCPSPHSPCAIHYKCYNIWFNLYLTGNLLYKPEHPIIIIMIIIIIAVQAHSPYILPQCALSWRAVPFIKLNMMTLLRQSAMASLFPRSQLEVRDGSACRYRRVQKKHCAPNLKIQESATGRFKNMSHLRLNNAVYVSVPAPHCAISNNAAWREFVLWTCKGVKPGRHCSCVVDGRPTANAFSLLIDKE